MDYQLASIFVISWFFWGAYYLRKRTFPVKLRYRYIIFLYVFCAVGYIGGFFRAFNVFYFLLLLLTLSVEGILLYIFDIRKNNSNDLPK